MQNPKYKYLKVISYLVFTGVLLVIVALDYSSQKVSLLTSGNLNLALFILAFVSSLLSFIKLFTRKKSKYIFVSIGFLGSSFVFTFYSLIPDATRASRDSIAHVFLSLFLLFSCLIWFLSDRSRNAVSTKKVSADYDNETDQNLMLLQSAGLGAVLLVVLAIFQIDYLASSGLAAFIYLLTLILYFRKNYWTYKYFEYYFMFSLIAFVFSQMIVLPLWNVAPDSALVYSEFYSVIGFSFALIGLLASSYNAFSLVETFGKQTEARLKASVEDLPLGYILLDETGTILVRNNVFNKLLDKKEITDNDLIETFDLKGRLKHLGENDDLVQDEIIHNTKYFTLYYSPVIMSTQRVGTVFLVQDDTQEKLLNKSKDEFIALASHELRTPISLVKGNVEILKTLLEANKLNPEDMNTILNDIDVSAIRLLSITEQFLDVSKLEQEKTAFDTVIFNLAEVVQDAINSLEEQMITKGLRLKLKFADKTMLVVGDPTKFSQIIENVVGNAIKFTSVGKITVEISKQDKFALIRVSDTGKGINEKEQKMLFKKFAQVGDDFYKHDSTQGVGLGLYICKMLASKMGGDILLESSKVDEGSTFVVKLPLAND